jgi:predicted negative regulator of RcsB-dependent stress response
MSRAILVLSCALGLTAGWAPVAAQRPTSGAVRTDTSGELDRMREAAALEEAGDLAGATTVLRSVLEQNPSSLTGLLTYERLLAVQGRIADVIPMVDRLLELDATSSIGHQVRLRVLAQGNDVAALERAVARWIQASPSLETPYREAAVMWRGRGDAKRAIALLEQGRKRIDRDDALALELGDAWADADDLRRAAAEWARAVGPDGRGFLLVQRRVQSQPEGGAGAIPALVDQLGAGAPTAGRRRAAALLAIEAGLEPRAERLVREAVAHAAPNQREQVLVELARRADAGGMRRIALWAYDELLRSTREAGAALAIRTRVAELALLAGDTARAAEVYRELEAASAAGSPRRRQAMALRIQLTLGEGRLDRAAEEVDAFRSEFGQTAELDATAALLATRLLESDRADDALRVVTGVSGPRTAQLRGRLFIRSGDLHAAREELLQAAPQLQGREATETISLAALLVRTSANGGEFVARMVAADDAERQRLVHDALADTERLPPAERAVVLDFVAGVADRAGMADDAVMVRHEIVSRLPRTPEAPAALLALARHALTQHEATDEATVLLERLILDYPRSALAPQARIELQRLQNRSAP